MFLSNRETESPSLNNSVLFNNNLTDCPTKDSKKREVSNKARGTKVVIKGKIRIHIWNLEAKTLETQVSNLEPR